MDEHREEREELEAIQREDEDDAREQVARESAAWGDMVERDAASGEA